MKSILTCSLMTLLWAAATHAEATLTGKWQGATPSGTQITLDLTATESALTGTMTRDGQSIKIEDGKVSKNRFTFKATINDRADVFSGEIAGDEIKVWPEHKGPERAAVLTRVKK